MRERHILSFLYFLSASRHEAAGGRGKALELRFSKCRRYGDGASLSIDQSLQIRGAAKNIWRKIFQSDGRAHEAPGE